MSLFSTRRSQQYNGWSEQKILSDGLKKDEKDTSFWNLHAVV
jgi:hypothetical protein